MISKVLRTLLPIYTIRVSSIQELRCTLGNYLTLDILIGRLATFELVNFDNYKTSSIECVFKSQLTLNGSKRKKKRKHVESDSESIDDLDELEALLERRLPKGKVKYKGKFPIIYFTCNKVGHIVARCLDRDENEERKDNKYRGRRDN